MRELRDVNSEIGAMADDELFRLKLPVAPLITALRLSSRDGCVCLTVRLEVGETWTEASMFQSLSDPEGVGTATIGPLSAYFDAMHESIGEWFDLPAAPLWTLGLIFQRALRLAQLFLEAEGEAGLVRVESALRAHLTRFSGRDVQG